MLMKSKLYSLETPEKEFIGAVNEMLQDRIAELDLKSYEFYKDPDCSYSFANKQL